MDETFQRRWTRSAVRHGRSTALQGEHPGQAEAPRAAAQVRFAGGWVQIAPTSGGDAAGLAPPCAGASRDPRAAIRLRRRRRVTMPLRIGAFAATSCQGRGLRSPAGELRRVATADRDGHPAPAQGGGPGLVSAIDRADKRRPRGGSWIQRRRKVPAALTKRLKHSGSRAQAPRGREAGDAADVVLEAMAGGAGDGDVADAEAVLPVGAGRAVAGAAADGEVGGAAEGADLDLVRGAGEIVGAAGLDGADLGVAGGEGERERRAQGEGGDLRRRVRPRVCGACSEGTTRPRRASSEEPESRRARALCDQPGLRTQALR